VLQIGKKLNKSLKLERVVDVSTQVVAGLNYRLVLDVSGGDHSTVEAVVYGASYTYSAGSGVLHKHVGFDRSGVLHVIGGG
jgi:hypothetical protein